MLDSVIQESLEKPRIIFMGNDSIAFFDVNNLHNEPINVADISYKSQVDHKKIHYFITDNYKGSLKTVSATGPCIVFCAFTTDENEGIKCSGIYHAKSLPPKEFFVERLYYLIDTVRSELDKRVIVKVAGSNRGKKYLQKIRDDLTELLVVKDVEIEPEYLSLGGRLGRLTEFHLREGQLISYLFPFFKKRVL